jgi:hypothetical protein
MIDQAVPFQRSASVTTAVLLVVVLPTATQNLLDGHDTHWRPVTSDPLGLGMGTTDHAGAPDDAGAAGGRAGVEAAPALVPPATKARADTPAMMMLRSLIVVLLAH